MNDVAKIIQNRQSTRGPYERSHAINAKDLLLILEAARWAPTAHNMQNFEIIVVDDRTILEDLANVQSPISQAFIKENYHQLSFSEEELRRKKVGILGTMFPEFMRNPKVKPNSDEQTASFQGKLVKTSPVLLVVLYDHRRRAPASEGDFLGIISLGCVMENMWLMASSLGINCHIVSSFNDDPAAQKVKELLNIPKDLTIALTCRLGYATRSAHDLRVRRDIEEFTYSNRYGNKAHYGLER
jgi:nitroreductase